MAQWTPDYIRFAKRYRDYDALTLDALTDVLDKEYPGMSDQERTYILSTREGQMSNGQYGLEGLRRLADGDYGLLSFYAKIILSEVDDQESP